MDPHLLLNRFAPRGTEFSSTAELGFKLLVDPLPHERYREAMFRIAELHQRRRSHGVGGGLLLTGPSGAGKTTTTRAYAANFPRQHQSDKTTVSVLFVSVPPSPTARSLAGAILESLGFRKAHRGSAPEKTVWIYELFAKCGVEILILDEFQHLYYAPSLNAFRDITDWLKSLLEDTKVGMVASGLPAAELVVSSNEQLARRFSERIRISPFCYDIEADFIEFRGILKSLETHLPVKPCTPLHEANLARRFLVGSYGLLDYATKILEGAVSVAATMGLETLDLDIYAAAFRNRVWRDVPDRLNPFYPESPLRPLDRSGEVFFLHTREDPIGSPVSRKLGMNLTRGGE